jgi:hypothetical protein
MRMRGLEPPAFADTLRGAGRVLALLLPAAPAHAATELVLKIQGISEPRGWAATDRVRGIEGTAAETSPRSVSHYVPAGSNATLAKDILSGAIQRYRGVDGFEGMLVETAWQLELIGKDAWLPLVEVARYPECEFFLGTMVRLEGVESDDRRSGLLAVAKNPDLNVRSRLLELLDEIPVALRRDLAITLARGDGPNDAVVDQARRVLTALES